jgi:hypothetical protein
MSAGFSIPAASAKRSKYGNTKVVMDGVKHASKKQGLRWVVLRQMEREGRIKNLRREVTYRLEVNGKLICKYIADHVYEEPLKLVGGGWTELVVEDVKSPATRKNRVYRIKRKLMAAIHGIDIKEV